ncbi:hypothetical protein KIN20_029286 [Parelaphostrongylus tenuis]|uniref:Uncharacterized protein n=1 Tax=Parelaphostrongylus tenuis TaxID=148309 RepID=A0AAD5R2A7_PARTN|nr:hypothetical protein KIN20_029286 [Parelaphostrongylus tenuis]
MVWYSASRFSRWTRQNVGALKQLVKVRNIHVKTIVPLITSVTQMQNVTAHVLGEPNKLPQCIIFGNTVTALCTAVPYAPPPDMYHKCVVMANWSREMWQNVVNKAVRMLASGPFGSHFFSALAIAS